MALKLCPNSLFKLKFQVLELIRRRNLRLLVFLALAMCVIAPIVFFADTRATKANTPPPPPPEAQADFIRQIPLTLNDVIYSPSTKMLYGSVPSSVGAGGNCIRTIDPLTGAITSSVFIGSEPNKLALADDGTSLYASLDGSYSIRRFDVSTQTPGLQFGLGQDPTFGLYRATDLAVAPGNPNLLAVARSYPGTSPPEAGVAAFDNGVRRTTAGPGHVAGSDYLSFSASADKLYGSGFYSGLTTLKIDANGVSITASSSLASGWRIKFDNGVVYGGNGQVIDPNVGNGTLKGTFSGITNSGGVVAFVPDSSVGRAYYLTADTFGSSTRILRAFDINTFLQVGSLTINGVIGDATNMIRWGSNGLAFRTTGNQLFIIQTSLIPSADPIPTPTPTPSSSPTPTPSPSPIATFVRQVSLTTNDLIYNAGTHSLYASVPSSIGPGGNSIAPIDPVTASVGTSVFVGSEPSKLALSDDSQTLYVGLNGSGSVRRFDLSSQTAGLQFALGNDFNGTRTANDLAVIPGAPGAVAVSRNNSSAAIYDDGVQRSQTSNGGSLAFRSSSTLYVASGSISKLAVAPGGLSFVSSTLTGSGGNIIYDNGLVYMSSGAVVDPEANSIKGSFSPGAPSGLMAVDSSNGKVFFLSTGNSNWVLRAFDINTFLPLGAVNIGGVNGIPSSLVRWGSNGLAFRTPNQIFLIQSALVNPADAVPSPTPTPSPTPSPSPPYIATFVNKLDLQANDLVYNQTTQRLYASVPSFQGANGNSITPIDPQTRAVGASVFVGSEPNKLALADDGQTLWMILDGANAVRKFDISTQTPGLQFPHGVTQPPADLEVMPANPQTVAVSLGINQLNSGVAIFDNGVKRANNGGGNYYAVGPIEFNGASTIYGYDSYSSGFELVKFSVSASGVAPVTVTNNLLQGFINGLKFSNGLLYSGAGRVVDPEAQKLVGTFQGSGFNSAIAVDVSLGKIFFLWNPGSSVILTAYDINTFVPLGSVTLLTNISGTPSGLVRWGSNGLAFRVATNFGQASASNPSPVYLVQSALVSNAAPIPTGVQLTSATINTSESIGNLAINVVRSGDVSGTTTIDYATSDGTAVAGSDYTSTSGTLTFAAGQLSKTITIPITSDNLYEGTAETFNITLSNPSSGTILSTPTAAVVTISDNESKPWISIVSSVSSTEGNSGQKNFAFVVSLSNRSFQTVAVDYATADGTATAGTDYLATSGTLTFPPGSNSATINVLVNGDNLVEPNESFTVRLSNASNASFISNSIGNATILNDDSSVQLGLSNYSVTEGTSRVDITVTRIGNVSSAASVNFSTSDTSSLNAACSDVTGKASERCDYATSLGTLSWAAGDAATKTFNIPIINDALVEGTETFNVTLSNAIGATLGATTTSTVTITDNDSNPPGPNPIDDVDFFITQQYIDFLGRMPDQGGFTNWHNTLAPCPNGGFGEPLTSDCDRLHVAAGFFQSDEFLNRGYWAFRFYMVSYNQRPTYAQFIPDMAQVGGPKSPAEEETSKIAFADAYVQRPEFVAKYPGLSGQPLANALWQTAGLSGSPITAGSMTRGQILRTIVETPAALNQFLVDGTVAIQYFGFLRRDPDTIGYQNNLTTLRSDPNNLRHMIFIFIYSTEYRGRFGTP